MRNGRVIRIEHDGDCATSTPSIAFEADRVDLRALLGVNEMLWYGCGSSESSVLGVFLGVLFKGSCWDQEGGHWGDSWNTQEEVE